MRWRRLVFFLGLTAALAIGIGLRLSTRRQLTAGGRARALTSDDDYHLRRARFAAAHYPRTIIFDPLMNFPRGGVAIWPPLFDVALATPARLFHGARGALGPGCLRGRRDSLRRSSRKARRRSSGRCCARSLRGGLAGAYSLDPVRPHRSARGGVVLRITGALALLEEPIPNSRFQIPRGARSPSCSLESGTWNLE